MYRLLIVDDEMDICENLRYLVDWSQFNISTIYTATSYQEAIDLALDFKPHIALVDVSLDNHWGFDLVAQLHAAGLQTKFCMISGYDDFSYVQKSMRSGSKNYLLKPVNVAELEAYLEDTIINELHGKVLKKKVTPREIDPILNLKYKDLSNITMKILLITKSNYQNALSLTSIAEMFNMNSKYIGRIFMKDTGLKYSDYLMLYRMMIAKELIISTRDKISCIASRIGYAHLNNFYVHFKSVYQTSPGSLRNFPDAADEQATIPAEQEIAIPRELETDIPTENTTDKEVAGS